MLEGGREVISRLGLSEGGSTQQRRPAGPMAALTVTGRG